MQLHNTFSLLIKINFQLPSLTQLIAYNRSSTHPPPPPPEKVNSIIYLHYYVALKLYV